MKEELLYNIHKKEFNDIVATAKETLSSLEMKLVERETPSVGFFYDRLLYGHRRVNTYTIDYVKRTLLGKVVVRSNKYELVENAGYLDWVNEYNRQRKTVVDPDIVKSIERLSASGDASHSISVGKELVDGVESFIKDPENFLVGRYISNPLKLLGEFDNSTRMYKILKFNALGKLVDSEKKALHSKLYVESQRGFKKFTHVSFNDLVDGAFTTMELPSEELLYDGVVGERDCISTHLYKPNKDKELRQ